MKLLASIVLLFFCCYSNAQIKNGIYKSSKISYRENYFLMVKNDSITLLGWELNLGTDTIYFKSCTNFKSIDLIKFDTFEFSKKPNSEKNLVSFQSEPKIGAPLFAMHRYFKVQRISDTEIDFIALKDIYDGRSDTFKFELLSN